MRRVRAPPEIERCPNCGTDLVSEPGIPGLCPQCVFSLALHESPPPSPEAETLDRPSPGGILGDRYQVREVLGRGGMGEVFRAFDLKLRVDVALKAVRAGRVEDERGREMLRREVRAAREVVSANVCRIFDLVVEEGQELVSMEFVDGTTLSEMLRERGPLDLQEAREIASQFLAGLEAIHQAGLVHRDFKPENVMITRAGRVVVMDFGLAKLASEERTATVSGTPVYMAPEQARGEGVDARADVYAAGVVLAEMLSAGGESYQERRKALWRAVREVPPTVPDGPWATVLRQSLAPSPRDRPPSAHALARALEEVTQRLPGFEEKRPYPGLASFTEEDAGYFFGREKEVEALWKKMKRPRLLALIGPSGAGKSSFLRAGLLPTLPPTWRVVITTPGSRPFQSLAQALVPLFPGDTEAMQALLRIEEPDMAVSLLRRFRQGVEHGLVIVDQFEELFTLSSSPTRDAFAALLERLMLEADLHVILSLRDDFLFRLHDHDSLGPAFSDLTPLGTLGESALRRALVQPALACGYRFEDESLVDEMVAEVVEERGALPLLAFAASRLWEKRDRDRGLLTRQSYREIGGVAGALAQHAESTLERIGTPRIPLVREIFRNLVTAQATRAVPERGELLSVFSRGPGAPRPRPSIDSSETPVSAPGVETRRGWGPEEAAEVLDTLVDGRLLTSYERAGESGESHQHVEIIHESLLSAWPRLVRWQTQDADGAVLRDQLRQAAQLWQDRGRTEDLLWSGQAYRDFALWRERYPAPLTAAEESFGRAMMAHAARRRRRRQVARGALVGVAATVAIVTSVLWHRADTSRRKAEAETLRAEAGKLLVMGERELQRYPTGALAYAIRSLELSDSGAGRLFALRVLQEAPVARIARVSLSDAQASTIDFSPNGDWVAFGGMQEAEVLHRDGQKRVVLGGYPVLGGRLVEVRFGRHGDVLVGDRAGDIRAWSIPEGRELARARGDEGISRLFRHGEHFVLQTPMGPDSILRSWSPTSGDPALIGAIESDGPSDVADGLVAYAHAGSLYARSLETADEAPRRIAAQAGIHSVALSPDGARVATSEGGKEIRIWPTATRSTRPGRVLDCPEPVVGLWFGPAGRQLFAESFERGHPTAWLFDLAGPPDAEPLALRKGDTSVAGSAAVDPSGRWLATTHGANVAFWPLGTRRAHVLKALAAPDVLFTPDGRLVSLHPGGSVHEWPLQPGREARILPRRAWPPSPAFYMTLDPSGRRLAFAGGNGSLSVVDLDGRTPPRSLVMFPQLPTRGLVGRPAFGDGGRLLAAGLRGGPGRGKVVRVFDLETSAVRAFGPFGSVDDLLGGGIAAVAFVGRDRLIASVWGLGLVSIDLATGTSRVAVGSDEAVDGFTVGPDARRGVGFSSGVEAASRGSHSAVLIDLVDGTTEPLASHGGDVTAVALDPTGSLVATGSIDGTVRIGPVSGEEPHLLLGRQGQIRSLAFSPDGRWLAASGEDFALHIFPVPDVSDPPLHRRLYDDLLAVLRSHTNLRAVPDPGSPDGYTLEPGPFPGWATPPEW